MKLRRRYALTLLVLAACGGTSSPPQTESALDDEPVRQMWETFETLYRRGDSEGIGQMYTEDSDRRNAQADFAQGRSAVQQMYEDIFLARPTRQEPEDQRTRFEYDVRFLRADVALIDGFYYPPTGGRGPFTVVATHEGDTWMMAAGRAAAVRD